MHISNDWLLRMTRAPRLWAASDLARDIMCRGKLFAVLTAVNDNIKSILRMIPELSEWSNMVHCVMCQFSHYTPIVRNPNSTRKSSTHHPAAAGTRNLLRCGRESSSVVHIPICKAIKRTHTYCKPSLNQMKGILSIYNWLTLWLWTWVLRCPQV